MALIRANSQNTFKPIPEDSEPLNTEVQSPDRDKTLASQDSATPEVASTPEAKVEELRKLLTDLREDRGGVRGGGGGSLILGGGGSRPSSRCSVRSSSRHGSRLSSRRSSLVFSEDEEEVTASQKAHLLVASQQRLVYSLQGLRHELSSLDEEVNRIRNDILNSRRFFNAMRGIPEQPTWGSTWRRNCGSGSSSPSLYSPDNSYSDEIDSMARSESCCSFTSWPSEAELYNAFREAEEASDKSSYKSNTPGNGRSDTSNSNDNGSNSSGGSATNNYGSRDTVNVQIANFPKLRGRYRQLGTPNHRA